MQEVAWQSAALQRLEFINQATKAKREVKREMSVSKEPSVESYEQTAARIIREYGTADAPPNPENGFISMTADTPAGYATFWGMNNLRKLVAAIKGKTNTDE